MRPFFILFLIPLLFGCSAPKKRGENFDVLIEKITKQLESSPLLSDSTNGSEAGLIFPRTLTESGKLKLVNKKDWTSGFYPGVLWFTYDLTGNKYWRDKATVFTNQLETEKFNAGDHDIGFKMMSSYGLGYKLTKNESYKKILIQSARTLTTRFNEKVGCIRSWDHHQDKWQFPVIIDNLMNLELLFWAWKETGDAVFYNIATSHAKTTMKNHFRNDYSCYHVVNYDTITGNVISKNTHQGFADESSWARGQAWALYGYTMIYRETKDPIFLKQAENVANYIINIETLPKDYVTVWDFDLKDSKTEPKDASAAAAIASALFELCEYSKDNKKLYLNNANNILASLSSDTYFNSQGSDKGFLLKHSTGSKPKNSEIDVPLIYADYYYLEALLRKRKLTTN